MKYTFGPINQYVPLAFGIGRLGVICTFPWAWKKNQLRSWLWAYEPDEEWWWLRLVGIEVSWRKSL